MWFLPAFYCADPGLSSCFSAVGIGSCGSRPGKNQIESKIGCYSKSTMVVEELQEALAEQWTQKQEVQ